MILHRLAVRNFGIYRDQVFDLTPQPRDGFDRPIVLFRGKNGSGKTTIIEAVRLCLHGSLALGSRVSRAAYEDHLARRIHVSPKTNGHPAQAHVALTLDYVNGGEKRRYDVRREWQVVQGNVREYVHILEDGQALDELRTREERDSFLRELVPSGVADLFFFDGERLFTLAKEGTSSDLLAETMPSLLGLHLVERLQKDLDIYLSRQRAGEGPKPVQEQLYDLTAEISALEKERAERRDEQRANEEAVARTRHAIREQEQRIASAGRWFSERLDDLRQQRERLEAEIEMTRRRVQELANGLMPFAISSQMCLQIADRLHVEEAYEREVAAQQILDGQIERVSAELEKPAFWEMVGVDVPFAARQKLEDKLSSVLRQAIAPAGIPENEVILRVSAEDRQMLLHWIDLATGEVPRTFGQTIHQLEASERALEEVDQAMQLVPADETLGPLVKDLQELNRELGRLEKMAADVEEAIGLLDYRLEQAATVRERLRGQIVAQERADGRVQLVGRTQLVLAAYAQDLKRAKLDMLQERLTARFNDLCRKEDLVDEIEIDLDTFEMTLQHDGHSFGFKALSAGERQLLAMATMWALKEVSGVPMPVVVDTPLGRLDADHRLNVVQNYFPHASHQVILLATDAEIDDEMLTWLAPAISHAYQLRYEVSQGETVVDKEALPASGGVEERMAR